MQDICGTFMGKLDRYIHEVLGFANLDKTEQLVTTMRDYVEMLFSWNDFYNMVGTKDPVYFIKRDIYDSLAIIKHLPGGKLLDVGSGGGIPGILIAMAKKESHLFLLDRKEKSIRFLEQVKLRLNVDNITIVKQSFEEFKSKDDIAAIILKNFSNKDISKMPYHEKILYVIKNIRNNLGENIPVYFLTGSKALELQGFQEPQIENGKNRFSVTEIESPFFENKRYLLAGLT